ncbi:MAG: hypothetical protein ACE5EC_03105 [Phycisphaerae bacterium]
MRRTLLIVIALFIPPTLTVVIPEWTRYPRRFAEVEPGHLYRGGYPSAEHIRNLSESRGIRTVVSLTGKIDNPEEQALIETMAELQINHRRFPMPGNGCGEMKMLDAAADALNRRADWPIFFHCKAGKQRSNAALAAYRMKYCGYTLEAALKELEDHYDLDRNGKEKELADHLAKYARTLENSE